MVLWKEFADVFLQELMNQSNAAAPDSTIRLCGSGDGAKQLDDVLRLICTVGREKTMVMICPDFSQPSFRYNFDDGTLLIMAMDAGGALGCLGEVARRFLPEWNISPNSMESN